MSLITDIRAVSENAIEQIAARFSGLPRPLLAAIGAGDMAVESLANLREALIDSIGERAGNPIDATDVRSAVSDLPAKAQKAAADVAGTIEQFAAEAPARAQEMIAQFPERLAEFQAVAQSLSPDAFKETFEAYTQLVGLIYGNLADRGDKTWSKVRAVGIRPGTIVDAVSPRAWPAEAAPAAPVPAPAPVHATAPVHPPASEPDSPAAPAAARITATKVTPTRPRAPRTAAPRAAAGDPVIAPGSARPATTGIAAPGSAAKPRTPKSTAKPATPKSTAKPATPKSTAGPVTP